MKDINVGNNVVRLAVAAGITAITVTGMRIIAGRK